MWENAINQNKGWTQNGMSFQPYFFNYIKTQKKNPLSIISK